MKKNIYYYAFIAFLLSCSTGSNNKAELDKLKAQRDQLNTKISLLENKINPTGKKTDEKAATVNVINATKSVFNH
jgi:peptidoglycan hydrolase CwlO-like protein